MNYRGDKKEAAYTLKYTNDSHGNFLEILTLLAKHNVVLKKHIDTCSDLSAARRLAKPEGRLGRGNFVTLISKNSVNHVIQSISSLIRAKIAQEVTLSGMFSIQIDTTQDITSQEQCSIIIRYVLGNEILERLLAVVKCDNSSGKALKNLVVDILKMNKIDTRKCIGSSTDGAASMSGEYNGFGRWLATEAPEMVHIWCYAHVLNLVISDTVSSCINCISLFGLLNKIAVFFKESYIRMDIWTSTLPESDRRRLNLIGETRWWAKDASLTKVFGVSGNQAQSLFVLIIMVLEKIENDTRSKPDARVTAKSYREGLLKYETILTAFLLRSIFDLTTPLSNYLQFSSLDILKAFHLVASTKRKMTDLREQFTSIKTSADEFVAWANDELANQNLESEIRCNLPEIRGRRRKRLPGELASDETIENPEERFKINCFYVTIDNAIMALDRRFNSLDNSFYADIALLDPKNFGDIRENGMKPPLLDALSVKLLPFNPKASPDNLRGELITLAGQWAVLAASPLDDYEYSDGEERLDAQNDDSSPTLKRKNEKHPSCKNCAICVFRILEDYRLLVDMYPTIGLAYKYMLTLSFTQVACERSFSFLKFIKNRLRNSMNQEKLDAFMLMALQKGILENLSSNDIIDEVAQKSSLLKKMLIF